MNLCQWSLSDLFVGILVYSNNNKWLWYVCILKVCGRDYALIAKKELLNCTYQAPVFFTWLASLFLTVSSSHKIAIVTSLLTPIFIVKPVICGYNCNNIMSS